jgi:hypothetical protein
MLTVITARSDSRGIRNQEGEAVRAIDVGLGVVGEVTGGGVGEDLTGGRVGDDFGGICIGEEQQCAAFLAWVDDAVSERITVVIERREAIQEPILLGRAVMVEHDAGLHPSRMTGEYAVLVGEAGIHGVGAHAFIKAPQPGQAGVVAHDNPVGVLLISSAVSARCQTRTSSTAPQPKFVAGARSRPNAEIRHQGGCGGHAPVGFNTPSYKSWVLVESRTTAR